MQLSIIKIKHLFNANGNLRTSTSGYWEEHFWQNAPPRPKRSSAYWDWADARKRKLEILLNTISKEILYTRIRKPTDAHQILALTNKSIGKITYAV